MAVGYKVDLTAVKEVGMGLAGARKVGCPPQPLAEVARAALEVPGV